MFKLQTFLEFWCDPFRALLHQFYNILSSVPNIRYRQMSWISLARNYSYIFERFSVAKGGGGQGGSFFLGFLFKSITIVGEISVDNGSQSSSKFDLFWILISSAVWLARKLKNILLSHLLELFLLKLSITTNSAFYLRS